MWSLAPATVLLASWPAHIPVPFAIGKIYQNTSGRFMRIETEPTLGLVRRAFDAPVGHAAMNLPSSECIWGSFESVLFLGPPPKACRRGKRLDGWSNNGFAVIPLLDSNGVEANVQYPVSKVPAPRGPFGPFSNCAIFTPGTMHCEPEPYTSVELFGNASSVWIHNPTFTAQTALFQALGIVQTVLFALMAARGKTNGRGSMNSIMALAADAAMGGAFSQTLLLALGRSLVGLDVELGLTTSAHVETAITSWCVSLAVTAYVHAAAYNANLIVPSLNLAQYSLPFGNVLRELCEVPLLVSLVVIWPESAGPHFLQQLQFMCGLAVSYVSGRASGLLQTFGPSQSESVIGAAFFLVGGVATATAMCLGTIASSGAITRGSPSVAFTLVLQIHVAAGGIYFGTASRLKQIDRADAASKSGQLSAQAVAASI